MQSETKLIPALTIAERYDSNVFLIQGGGGNLEDYVTTVTPQLRVDHTGQLVTGSLTASVVGEAYVKNPGFNYAAPSAALSMNLDNFIGLLDRRAKLKVSDNFMYTPTPLAFLGPQSGSQVPDAFVRGVQAARANSLTNMATGTAAYQLTPGTTLQGVYMHSMMRFGQVLATPSAGRFFNTTFQTLNVGPQFQISPRDTLSVNYQYVRSDFSSSGLQSGFETQGGTLGWTRILTPTLTASASGGVTLLGGGLSRTVQYLADASLEWKHERTSAILRYSRSVFPSFYIVATPLLSQVVTGAVTYSLTQNLAIIGSANYAKNEAIPAAIVSFNSYATSLSLNYTVTRSVTVTAMVTRSHFDQSFLSQSFAFDRNIVSLSLRGEWN